MASKAPRVLKERLDAAAQACSRNGAQLTELRRSVLRLILDAGCPLTAYQLLDRLKQTRQSALPPTIYRALDFLMQQGLVHKIERLNAFVPCAGAGCHHSAVQLLICRKCGAVAEIEDRGVSRALRHAAKRQGFHTGYAVVELDGTCAACSPRS